MTDENIPTPSDPENQPQRETAEGLREKIHAAVEALDKLTEEYLSTPGKSELAVKADNDARSLETAFENWVAAGEVGTFVSPIHLKEYGLDHLGIVEADDELVEPAEKDTIQQPQIQHEGEWSQLPSSETPEIERPKQARQLKIKAQNARDDGNYDEALKLIQSALEYDLDDEDARGLEQKIRQEQKEQKIRQLKTRLKTVIEINDLEKAIQEAVSRLEQPGFEDVELENLKEEARNRRDSLKTEMQIITSSEQLREYLPAHEALDKANRMMSEGQVEIDNQRTGTRISITDFIKDVQQQLVKLAAAFMQAKLDRAYDLMPEAGPRNPLAAKKELEETKQVKTQELFGTGDSLKKKAGQITPDDETYQYALQELKVVDRQVQAELDRCEREGRQWIAAQDALKLAEESKDALVRLYHLQSARTAYRYHEDIEKAEESCYRHANVYLIEEIQQAIARGEDHLIREEQEAVEQRGTGKIGPLAVFAQARAEVEEAGKKLVQIEETWRTDPLKIAIDQLSTFTKKVEERSLRRTDIRTDYAAMANLLASNQATLAKDTYAGLPPDYQTDGEIRGLYIALQASMSDEDHLQLAESAYATGSWEQVIDECGRIRRTQGGMRRADILRGMATLFLLRRKIETAWQRRYFDDCDEEIVHLLTLPEAEPEVQQQAATIIVDLQVEQKKLELQHMKQVDAQYLVPAKLDQINEALERITDVHTGEVILPGEQDANFDLVTELYDRVDELDAASEIIEYRRVWSTRKGKLADLKKKLGLGLRAAFLPVGEDSLADQSEHLERAYNLAAKLHHRALDNDKPSAQLCRNVVEAYYQKKVTEWISGGKWKEAIGSLEQAVNNYPDLYIIREMLDNQRRDYLLLEVDTNLGKDWECARRLLRGEERPDAIGATPSFHFSTESDPALRLRSQVCKKFEDAQIFIKDKKYQRAATFVKNIDLQKLMQRRFDEDQENANGAVVVTAIEHEPRLKNAIRSHAKQIIEQAIAELEVVAGANVIADRASAYARILQIDADHMIAQQWIEANAKILLELVDKKLTDAKTIKIDTLEVSIQLRETENLIEELENLVDVMPYFGTRAKKDELERTANELKNNILSDLKVANKLLADFGPSGSDWIRCVSTGNWIKAEEAVDALFTILPETHPQIDELRTKIDIYKQYRLDLRSDLTNLRNAFTTDAFEEARKAIDSIERILRSCGVKNPGDDPFQLVTKAYSIYDVYEDKDVLYYSNEKCPESDTIAGKVAERGLNATDWENYQAMLLKLYKELVGMHVQGDPIYEVAEAEPMRSILEKIPTLAPEISLLTPTLKMKEDLQVFLIQSLLNDPTAKDGSLQQTDADLDHRISQPNVCIPRITAQPAPPCSNRAELACNQVQWMKEQLSKSLGESISNWKSLTSIEKKYRDDLSHIALSVIGSNKKEYDQAKDLYRFWRGSSETDLLDFLDHLVIVTAGGDRNENSAAE